MRLLLSLLILVVAVVLWPAKLVAETIVLRGGRPLDGELLGYDPKTQELRVRLKEGGVLILRRGDVERIEFTEATSVLAPPDPVSPRPPDPFKASSLPAPARAPTVSTPPAKPAGQVPPIQSDSSGSPGSRALSVPRPTVGGSGPSSGTVASANDAHQQLLRLSPGQQTKALGQIAGCAGTAATFKGMDRQTGQAFWRVDCANKKSFLVAIDADRQGSTRVVDCGVDQLLRQLTNKDSAKDLCLDPW